MKKLISKYDQQGRPIKRGLFSRQQIIKDKNFKKQNNDGIDILVFLYLILIMFFSIIFILYYFSIPN